MKNDLGGRRGGVTAKPADRSVAAAHRGPGFDSRPRRARVWPALAEEP